MVTKEQKEQIVELRKQKKSYGDIAKAIGIKRDQVKGYIKSIGFKNTYPELIGFVKGQQGDRLTTENINSRIKKKYPNYEYVGGYVNCESIIDIKCNACGNIIKRCASILRKNRELTCNHCIEIRNTNIQTTKALDRYIKNKEIQKSKEEEYTLNHTKKCKECGKEFMSIFGTKYCTKLCARKHNNRVRDIHRRHKIKDNGKIDWDITLDKLIKRDKGICKICNKDISDNDYTITSEGYHIAGCKYPSIDHIKSVSKGGTHTWDNIQLAHRNCNSIKSNNDIYNKESGQLIFAI